jgi:hypothetical protein
MASLTTFVTMMILGSCFGIVIFSATGLLGGFAMAWIVKSLLKSISANNFRVIILGWFVGIVAGFTVSYLASAVLYDIAANYLFIVILIGGLIAGGVGSGIMYHVIDRELAG